MTNASLAMIGPTELAPHHVEPSPDARRYAEAAWAPSSRRTYRAQWAAFVEWCAQTGADPLAAQPVVVANYLAHRASQGSKVSTIAVALSAITEAHRAAGYASPRGTAEVKHLWKGIRRQKGIAPVQKAALGAAELRRFVKAGNGDLRALRDAAIALLGLASACRRSELVALDVEDLREVEEALEILIRRSKADQEGRGLTKTVCFGSTPSTCPVRAVRRWIEAAGIESGPLFRPVARGVAGRDRLDARVVARIAKRVAKASGLDPAKYAGHSLRSGFVTAALRGGASEKDVMSQTGHASAEMVLRYARRLSLWESPASARLGL